MVNRFEQLLFPCFCLLCGAPSRRPADICAPCQQELPLLGPHCQRCALPLANAISAQCGQCLKKAPDFQRLIAGWRYQGSAARLISQFKYQRQHSYGRVLADLLAEQILEAYEEQAMPDLLVATPMHWLRRLKRGFNHSEQLASHLSQRLGIPVYRDIRRVRNSKPQQTLNAELRRHNLKSVFRARQLLDGQRIAVVDDVVTTGATANELSRTLLKAGADEVHIWCLARTPK
jgi:ComF family protein